MITNFLQEQQETSCGAPCDRRLYQNQQLNRLLTLRYASGLLLHADVDGRTPIECLIQQRNVEKRDKGSLDCTVRLLYLMMIRLESSGHKVMSGLAPRACRHSCQMSGITSAKPSNSGKHSCLPRSECTKALYVASRESAEQSSLTHPSPSYCNACTDSLTMRPTQSCRYRECSHA